MTRLYDLMLLLDSAAPGEAQEKILSDVRTRLDDGANIVNTQEWGQRRIAFEIDDRPDAEYHLLQFETDSRELLEQLDHSLKITDGVLRFRIIRVKPGTPAPPIPRGEGAARFREEGRDEAPAPAASDAPAAAGADGPAPAADAPAPPREPAEGAPPRDTAQAAELGGLAGGDSEEPNEAPAEPAPAA